MDFRKKVIRNVKETGDAYSQHPALRGGVALIPFVGGALDAMMSGAAGIRWQMKIESFFVEINERFNRHEEQEMDKGFIEGDEFESIVISILEGLRKTHEKEKIGLYANILRASCLRQYSREYHKERFIHLVTDLSMTHIAILNLFRKNVNEEFIKDNKQVVMDPQKISEELDIDKYDAELCCAELVSSGLLFDPFIGTLDYRKGSHALHRSALKFFEFLFETE